MEISEISDYSGASQSAVEKNLKYLRELGKVKREVRERRPIVFESEEFQVFPLKNLRLSKEKNI